MKIHQLYMKYDGEQDRIIFRVNTVSKEECRFFFTRRFVKLLWPILLDLLERDYKDREPEQSHIAGTMLPFEHNKMTANADFGTTYSQDVQNYPLGEKTILLSQIKVKRAAKGYILCLHPKEGNGIELKMTEIMLHSFCKLLRDNVRKADWDMDVSFDEGLKMTGSILREERLLH
jgi:hypothetical protein